MPGNPKRAMFVLPKSVNVKTIKVQIVKILNTILLSITFNRNNPRKHPTVIIPQNSPTVLAPSISGRQAMISSQKLRDPVRNPLLSSHVANIPKKKRITFFS